jgi:hypothetical protein
VGVARHRQPDSANLLTRADASNLDRLDDAPAAPIILQHDGSSSFERLVIDH